MDIFESRYYKMSIFLLAIVGMWPYQNYFQKMFIRCLIFFSLTVLCLIPQIFGLLAVLDNVDDILDCLPPLFVVCTCYGQTLVYLYNEEKLKKLFEIIREDWKIWSSGTEYEILCKFSEDGRTFVLLFSGYMMSIVGTFVLMPMTPIALDFLFPLNETRPKQLVIPVVFPFNHEKHFTWILVHGFLTCLCNVTIITSCEGMFAVMTQHACGLFAIVSYRLKNALKIIEDKKIGGTIEEELYNDMAFAINRHCYAIEFSKMLESFYSPVLLSTFGFNLISTSVVGIQTLISLGEWDKTIKFGVFTCGLVIHLYCISFQAQKLLDCSAKVVQNVYDVCWYQMPIKSRKLLSMIIMRGHIPCRLTAGKFYTVDMITFSDMVKTAISYFTVLTSVR